MQHFARRRPLILIFSALLSVTATFAVVKQIYLPLLTR